MAGVGYDISASASTSSSAATGATSFSPVTITNLGTGNNSILVIGIVALVIWLVFGGKK